MADQFQPPEGLRKLIAEALTEPCEPCGATGRIVGSAGEMPCVDCYGEGRVYLPEGDMADAVLAALFAACEVREEWGCRLTWDDGHNEDSLLGERKYAQLRYDLHQQKRADNPGWRVTPTLIRRYVLTTTAEPVSSTGEESGDG